MKILVALLVLALPALALADDVMIKVVFRQEAPDIPAGSFALRPKTLYSYKTEQGRVEEVFDPAYNLQQVVIANGKDDWIVNLADKTGTHVIDPGPTYNFYVPIVPPDKSKPNAKPPLVDFQIGHEFEFMAAQKISAKPVTKDHKAALLYECVREGYTLDFYVDPVTNTPIETEVLQGGKLLARLVYLEYNRTLPPDLSLFQPPPNFKISEQSTTKR